MNAPSLPERIGAAWDGLSPQEQRVAEFLRARPDESALYNSSELARLTGVSKATVSRLYRRLGFAASSEVRDLLRAQRGAGLPVAVEEEGDPAAAHVARDVANLTRMLGGLDGVLLRQAAGAVAEASRVTVVGLRSGFPVAMLLRQALVQARDDVRLVPEQGQTLGEDLVGLTARDVVVVVGLRRRPAVLPALLASLAAGPARTVLVADPSLPPAPATWRFDVPIESASAFDSYAAAVSLTSLLASAVLDALGGPGAARVDEISDAYGSLGELSS